MFCTKCGKQLKGNEKFCSKCGARVNINVTEEETYQENLTAKNLSNPFAENEMLAKLNNNIVFKELVYPSGRRSRTKYIVIFLVAFFIFYMAGTLISWRGSEIRNTIASVVRCLMIIICFVNLCKRLHDFDRTAAWALPIFAFSYIFYYFLPPYIYHDMIFAYSHEMKFYKTLIHICLLLTVLPHVIIYFIKGTAGINQYGREE